MFHNFTLELVSTLIDIYNEIPEDHIADIYERGYKLKGKVMKHARVIVSSGKPAENTAGDKSQE